MNYYLVKCDYLGGIMAVFDQGAFGVGRVKKIPMSGKEIIIVPICTHGYF